MELMDTSLDKFYKQVIEKGLTIPEDILGKIAVSVGVALGGSVSRLLAALQQCSSCHVCRLSKLWSICTATCRSSIEVTAPRLASASATAPSAADELLPSLSPQM